MKFTGKILSVGTPRQGVSQKTNEQWAFTPVVMEINEVNDQTLTETQHKIAMDVRGLLDTNRVQKAITDKEQVPFTMFFDVREYQGKQYNDVKGYLPKEFLYQGF